MKNSIPDNPKDILSTTKPTIIKLSPKIKEKREFKINEKIFFEVLTKKEQKIKKERINGIFTSLEIFSFEPLVEKNVKYYKFPFTHIMKYEDNDLSQLIYQEYKKALIGAYNNLKNGNLFYLLYNKELIVFNKKTILPMKFKNLLENNDIIYREEKCGLVLEGREIALFFDVILNMKINYTQYIPFIISDVSFENSIAFKSQWVEYPPVKCKDKIKYHYKIMGYLVGDDFKEYYQHDVFSKL
ncbi:hypothetical protein SLOPH_1775 [Spraguea lophii 42_110]|uniref:Uncharacterized protein n=1 Tax=Spraguea lophii (strain 42_110) TaxID=1358809 RepID=S7W8Z0_SPRLO|nr:hypothetical protein SLOPH_1775 [Spraguea lophii 42_110]